MRHLLVVLTALPLFTAAPAVAGNFEDAVAAYGAGEYQKAVRLWKPLAEQGHPSAQYNLGVMYDFAEGVPEDDTQAVHWYGKAAEQGHADAQNNLGLMYDHGEGVPQDDVQAYAWYSVAAAQGVAIATNNEGSIARTMTREQIAQAQKLSSELWDKYVEPFQSD